MHLLVLAIFRKYWLYFNNISDIFRNILEILQYFQGIFLQYFLNISVLFGILFPIFINNNTTIKKNLICNKQKTTEKIRQLATWKSQELNPSVAPCCLIAA